MAVRDALFMKRGLAFPYSYSPPIGMPKLLVTLLSTCLLISGESCIESVLLKDLLNEDALLISSALWLLSMAPVTLDLFGSDRTFSSSVALKSFISTLSESLIDPRMLLLWELLLTFWGLMPRLPRSSYLTTSFSSWD